jgi:diguanylate cyclase (GGDEF)-like protein
MNIKNKLLTSSILLKSHVNRYTFLGLVIALGSILTACIIVSYQLTGHITLEGIVAAQISNPAIWILDLTPFMFIYWGQAFCEGIVNQAQSILIDKTDEFLKISSSLELKLKYESNHDNVTKLPNNHMFSGQISNAIDQLGTQGQLAVIVVKINDFENISYNFGTFNANNVLKQFADKLNAILVEPYMLQVSLGISSVARLQGEEFVFLLPRLKAEFDADELLSALHQSMISNFMIDGVNIKVTSTSGMAIYPSHGEDEEALLSHANIDLYNAKKMGLLYLL